MKISLIAALDRNRVIGSGNRMPWHHPPDLKRFRAITSGHPVVMGRKTYESIGRPLPSRRNVVISRNPEFGAEGIEVVTSLEAALERVLESGAPEVFVIGGGEIYRQALPLADRLHLTLMETEVEGGDAWFPDWSGLAFRETSREEFGEPLAGAWITLDREKRNAASP